MSAQPGASSVLDRVDLEYIDSVAVLVSVALTMNRPVESSFQPGDMTRYDLLFVPVHDLPVTPVRLKDGRAISDERCAFGVGRHVGSVVVAWCEHGAYQFDLSAGGFAGAYVASKLVTANSSGVVLAHLFNRIGDALAGKLERKEA